MKKKLLFSLALLVGAFMAFADKPVNVADKYLENHTYPFTYVNKFTAEGDTVVDNLPEDAMRATNTVSVTVAGQAYDFFRFRKLAGPWVLEGTLGEEGNLTGWHVDIEKGAATAIKGALTLTNGWDGFAPSIDNAKVYQTTKATLPAGKYNFKSNWAQDQNGKKWTFFVVTKGTSLPDTAALVGMTDPNVLGYTRLADSLNIDLELTEAQNLTIGFVSSFPENPENPEQGYAVAMGSFEIVTILEGLTDYTKIKEAVSAAKRMTENDYPIGTIGGTYPLEKWDAFVAARDAAQAIIDAENTSDATAPDFTDTHTQAEVDAAIAALESAIAELNASFILPFKLSSDEKEVWYNIHDRRSPTWYWTIGESELNGELVPRLLNTVKDNVNEESEEYQFKFVKNSDGEGYLVYSKKYPDTPLSINTEANNFVQIAAGQADGWLVKGAIGGFKNYYRVYAATDGTKQLNTFRETQGGIIGFWNATGQDPGNDFYFKRIYGADEINMSALKAEYAKVITIQAEQFPIGTEAGQFPQDKWDAFVAAKTTAKDIIDSEDTAQAPTDQAVVDAATEALKNTFDALVVSMIPPIEFSTATEDVWYVVHDKRTPNSYYWRYDVNQLKLAIQVDSLVDLENDDALQFKFVKPDNASGNEFLLYSKVADYSITYFIDASTEMIFSNYEAGSDTTHFVTAKTPAYDPEHFIVYVNGYKNRQLNSNRNALSVGFWNPGSTDDPGNDWKFIPVKSMGVKNLSAIDLGIFVSNRMIKSRNEAELKVYNISGQKMNALKPLAPGVYVVTVKGKSGAAKVIVK